MNADFESGFASDPEGVAASVNLAIQTGVSGLSIEDRNLDGPFGLYDLPRRGEAPPRCPIGYRPIRRDVMLVARTEGLPSDPAAVNPAIDRLVAFADAGADCLYAPGVRDKADIAAMVRAVAPRPLNVLAMGCGPSVVELAVSACGESASAVPWRRLAWAAVLGGRQTDQGWLLRRSVRRYNRQKVERHLRRLRLMDAKSPFLRRE